MKFGSAIPLAPTDVSWALCGVIQSRPQVSPTTSRASWLAGCAVAIDLDGIVLDGARLGPDRSGDRAPVTQRIGEYIEELTHTSGISARIDSQAALTALRLTSESE